MSDWASEYFERGYGQRWGLLQVTDRIQQQVDSLWSRLGLSTGARVVDLGCGHGRYALAFAARRAEVVGVDTAFTLIEQARRLAEEQRLAVRWIRGTMRAVPLQSGRFDTVMLIDAFGFFEQEEENDHVLTEAARLLRPGGWLVLKVVNGGPIISGFRHADREERNGVVVTVSRTLWPAPPRVIERLSISGAGGSGHYERRQRLYRADEVSAAANRAGFPIVDMFADAGGAPLDPATSSTMWVIGRLKGPSP